TSSNTPKKPIYLNRSINYFFMLNNSTLRDKYPSYDGQVNGVFAVKSCYYFGIKIRFIDLLNQVYKPNFSIL
ncbi:hypothetical protein, partial [Desulfitobacterium sp.]|uniref:hypothetical protein n=1 Tax=Desulfitobacterium sp. TaxID=49981 RepID=UPI002B205317